MSLNPFQGQAGNLLLWDGRKHSSFHLALPAEEQRITLWIQFNKDSVLLFQTAGSKQLASALPQCPGPLPSGYCLSYTFTHCHCLCFSLRWVILIEGPSDGNKQKIQSHTLCLHIMIINLATEEVCAPVSYLLLCGEKVLPRHINLKHTASHFPTGNAFKTSLRISWLYSIFHLVILQHEYLIPNSLKQGEQTSNTRKNPHYLDW